VTIRVYVGTGTSRNGSPLLIEELSKYAEYDVAGIDENEMRESKGWKTETTTLIFAGQSVGQFKKALGDDVLETIQRQVYEGAFNYIGICAGAAFGSEQIKYRIKAVHSEEDIRIANTGLGFFNGLATGPCRSVSPLPFSGGSENLHLITLRSLTDGRSFNAFHWGGPALIPTGSIQQDQGKILSCLQNDGTPMSLQLKFGKGRVTLCSFHPEIHSGNIHRWAEARFLPVEESNRLAVLAERLDGTAFKRFLKDTDLAREFEPLDPALTFA
jgi:glutamine amidotransferase-like uncharacterized protein